MKRFFRFYMVLYNPRNYSPLSRIFLSVVFQKVLSRLFLCSPCKNLSIGIKKKKTIISWFMNSFDSRHPRLREWEGERDGSLRCYSTLVMDEALQFMLIKKNKKKAWSCIIVDKVHDCCIFRIVAIVTLSWNEWPKLDFY